MKKGKFFVLSILFTVVCCCVSLSACSNEEPEPEQKSVYGYLFNVQISPRLEDSPMLEAYRREPPHYVLKTEGAYVENVLKHNTSGFTFKADPTMDVELKSIILNFDTVSFSDIKDGIHTFECGAKLTMISDTEFSVSGLPEFVMPYQWQNVAYIFFDMKPSFSLIMKNPGMTESINYEGERMLVGVCLYDYYYYNFND